MTEQRCEPKIIVHGYDGELALMCTEHHTRHDIEYGFDLTLPALAEMVAEHHADHYSTLSSSHRPGDATPTVGTVDLMLAQLARDRGTAYWGEPPHSGSLDGAESWLLSLRDHLETPREPLVHYAWRTAWPHAMLRPLDPQILTTENRAEITCPACRFAAGSQK